MLKDMVFWSLAAGMGSLPSLCSTAPGERKRSQQSSQTGEIRTLTPSVGVQGREDEHGMGHPEKLPGGGEWDWLGRFRQREYQPSVKRSNNFDPIGFLGGLNELLFRNAWHIRLLGEGTTYGLSSSYFPPPLLSPCDLKRDIPPPYWRQQDLDNCSETLGYRTSNSSLH